MSTGDAEQNLVNVSHKLYEVTETDIVLCPGTIDNPEGHCSKQIRVRNAFVDAYLQHIAIESKSES